MLALLLVIIFSSATNAAVATKEDVQLVRDEIKQLIHHMDKRFESVDKRFEDMNRRFDMLMWFIGILTIISTATIGYMISRINRQDDKISAVENRYVHVDLSTFIRDVREADPSVRKSLREALK